MAFAVLYNIICLLSSMLLFSNTYSYRIVASSLKDVELKCVLPPEKKADIVVLKQKIDKGGIKLVQKIGNAGKDAVCYCGDPPREYIFTLLNVSRTHEGSYRCIFRYNDVVSHRHLITLRVMPLVTVYAKDEKEKNMRRFIINRTRTLDDSNVYISALAGGVNIEDALNTLEYTKNYQSLYIMGNTNYDDCATSVYFTVRYHDFTKTYTASICEDNIIEIPDNETPDILVKGIDIIKNTDTRHEYKKWSRY
ncbi:V-type Ig domain [Turkeypox virus]|uniref:V-type Ig domain n=1 Tax=Turkeypox virus TaxID=336486 RepID=A0A0M3PB44_9POXV|nr:V-type Ig domain [Turkeypox virus]ALA62376.1 V-type Ig domain [Turkeypox virus]